jgi:hypothetical protein
MNNAKNNTIQKYQPMNVRKFLIALNLMLFAIAARAQESAQFSFSLQECLDYAYEHNQNVIVANLEKKCCQGPNAGIHLGRASTK